jgi:PhnB protein
MLRVIPSFTFNGLCSQAIELYKKAFGAEVKMKVLFSEGAKIDPKYFQNKSEAEKNYVYHAQIKIGKQLIILADDSTSILKDDTQGISGKSSLQNLLIDFDSDDELKAAYEILSDGATILLPLHSPTYCSLYAFLVDKFGGRWELMSGYKYENF